MARSKLKAIVGRLAGTRPEPAAASDVVAPPPPSTGTLEPAVAELLVEHPKLVDNVRILGEQLGQAGSIAHGQPADALGRPLPWYTYPAIEYLERLALDGARIFEFGCGNSTRYWCRRGARVTAVEHSREWFDELEASVESAELLYRPDRDSYVSALRESGASFDVIVVDGVWRERCVDEAIARAAPHTIIILDNSDWYHEAGARLRTAGFLDISFSGFGPCNNYTWTTSLFFGPSKAQPPVVRPPVPVGGIQAIRTDLW
jgi:hypothetical protein